MFITLFVFELPSGMLDSTIAHDCLHWNLALEYSLYMTLIFNYYCNTLVMKHHFNTSTHQKIDSDLMNFLINLNF